MGKARWQVERVACAQLPLVRRLEASQHARLQRRQELLV